VSYYCPNCQTTAAPKRTSSAVSLALLALPLVIGFGIGALGVAPSGFGGMLALAATPFALAGALAAQGRKCSRCGWRHIVRAEPHVH